jgi:hypothetical protein
MKYGRFKYGAGPYGIFKAVALYVKARVIRAISIVAGIQHNPRVYVNVHKVVAIDVAIAPRVIVDIGIAPPIEVSV